MTNDRRGLLTYDLAKMYANCVEGSILFRMPYPEIQYYKGDVYWDDIIPREDQRADDWLVIRVNPDGRAEPVYTEAWPP